MAAEVDALEASHLGFEGLVRGFVANDKDLFRLVGPVEILPRDCRCGRFKAAQPEIGEGLFVSVVEDDDFGVRRFLRTVQNPIERFGRGLAIVWAWGQEFGVSEDVRKLLMASVKSPSPFTALRTFSAAVFTVPLPIMVATRKMSLSFPPKGPAIRQCPLEHGW